MWLFIYILIACAVFFFLDWAVRTAPFVEPTWKPTIRWLLLVVAGIVAIGIVLNTLGIWQGGPPRGFGFRRLKSRESTVLCMTGVRAGPGGVSPKCIPDQPCRKTRVFHV
jgi:hypothetical protein